MLQFGRSFLVPLLMISLPLTASVLAQTTDESASVSKVRTVPPAVAPRPFLTVAPEAKSVPSIEFRPAGQMRESDRLLVSNDESSIAEHAATNGFNLDEGRWSYEQIVCPALPNHVFLRYTQNNGDRDITVFSASVPRNGEGRARIIPIQRRSYSLFSPAPINALTISAFNHIRAEEGTGRSTGWLGIGLCYAALAGANPEVAPADADALGSGVPLPLMGAILEVPVRGGEVIKFVDSAAARRPMEWTMTFTEQGKLVKATHTPAAMSAARPVPASSAVKSTRQVP